MMRRKVRRYKLEWGLVGLLLAGCSFAPDVLRFHSLAYQNVDSEALQSIFEDRFATRFEVVPAAPGESAMDALLGGRADLVLVNNSTPFTSGVRAVLPVYESVLHLLAREDLGDFGEDLPLRGRSIYIANESLAGRNAVLLIAERQNLVPGDYQLADTLQPGTTDIVVYFGPINPKDPPWYHPGYRLINLHTRLDPNAGSSRIGVEYILPRMRVVSIPPRTYDIPGNETAVHTVGVDTLLVTRKDASERVIYRLTEMLIEQKPRFAAVAPSLFSTITDSFDPLDLSFPLHEGARRYLERDEPSLLERYAETINMLVYVTFLVLTGSIAFMRWRAHRKKNRIDTFYERALSVRKQSNGTNQAELLGELRVLEEEAFQMLIDDQLAADESFRIFTDLLAHARLELTGPPQS
jgi:hypothetical protein